MPLFAEASTLRPWRLALRPWQDAACRRWASEQPDSDLWVATPGAGKTKAAARLAHAVLSDGAVERVIYVVPRDHLRQQTAKSFSEGGVDLDHRFANASPRLSEDVHGAVVTYQQVVLAPHVFSDICERYRTLVVFDEVHHAGDAASWGEAMRSAFAGARHRLALSGTPFRQDGQPLPFVTYRAGRCVPGFSYDYRQALADGVCRPIVFGIFDGLAKWISRDGSKHEATFKTPVKKKLQAERLRTHLMADSLEAVVLQADRLLAQLRRKRHAAAGGLVVCMNVEHANAIAALLQRVSGARPAVVVSSDPEAAERISAFADSRAPWIVAVHMISEGIDIPRLMVGVYASNVRSELYFKQFAGRFVRMQAGLGTDQCAYIYVPGDPTIRTYAEDIKAEVAGAIQLARKLADPETVPSVETNFGYTDQKPSSKYQALHASGDVTDTLHGEIPDLDSEPTSWESEPQQKPGILVDQKASMQREVCLLVARLSQTAKVDRAKIFATLKRRCGGALKGATLAQLHSRKVVLETWIQRNNYDGFR